MANNDKEHKSIKKLLILRLRYEKISDELLAKASGMNKKTIKNTFPLGKRRKDMKNNG